MDFQPGPRSGLALALGLGKKPVTRTQKTRTRTRNTGYPKFVQDFRVLIYETQNYSG
jgi:hypothetical protein